MPLFCCLLMCTYMNSLHYLCALCGMSVLCTERYKRLLFELAKVGREVRELRKSLERQNVQTPYDPTKDVVPELVQGPLKTMDEYNSLTERCSEVDLRSSLVYLHS